jgi:hypothetical protein
MNIVPARIQEHVNRVDRTRSLAIGISAGLTALWSVYRLCWLLYTTTTFSSVDPSRWSSRSCSGARSVWSRRSYPLPS